MPVVLSEPMLSRRWQQRIIVLCALISATYIGYRGLFTLNTTTAYATCASVSLFVAELFGVVSVLLFYLQVWDPWEPDPLPPLENRTVDVLIPTYNEDVSILRATVEACNRLDYPHVTYICDDGKRPQVAELAKELGVEYITRPDNRHAKAGNLNHALAQTEGEFVIILDADHVAEPHFITRLIGYFRDEQLGYVQTPHAYYNFDSLQARYNHRKGLYWEEGQLFYSVIQPGRNRYGIATFAGAAAMFRRRALEDVGYIATETITEDLHTGLRLNAKGWKGLGISERMIAGQAAPDITTFYSQRLRWGEGNLSILAYDNPLTMRGLSLVQRLCYLGSMIHWAGGLFRLVIYLTPILMMFTGVPPVAEFNWVLVSLMLIYLFGSYVGVKVASQGYVSVLQSELSAMLSFWVQVRATMRAMFLRRFQRFIVTSKRGPQTKKVWPYIRPQIALAVVSVLALVWGWARVATGVSDDIYKPIMPTIWIVIHLWIIALVLKRALRQRDGRFAYRHLVPLPVCYAARVEDQEQVQGLGMTANLSETGVALIAFQNLPAGATIQMKIRGGTEVVTCAGTVRWSRDAADHKGFWHGIQFEDLAGEQFDAVNRIIYHYAVPRLYEMYDTCRRDTLWQWLTRGRPQLKPLFDSMVELSAKPANAPG
jgi:cellulose synthase/poly-beta-1,6-N-acetylglucosamine synthase-like glycosyltransferase